MSDLKKKLTKASKPKGKAESKSKRKPRRQTVQGAVNQILRKLGFRGI
ncbi:MAG: hypothetical protein LBU87_05875 [Lactobacillales bacterium]|jgi:hypothetical protein|nr:hypothetical protein [Lactobacillales bacterium]